MSTADTNLDDGFAEWVKSLLERHHIPGVSIAVIDNGKVEATGYGLARLPDIPATRNTLYCMASTTKAITAAMMGLVLEKRAKTKDHTRHTGKMLKWSTPIVGVLGEDFDLGDDYMTSNVSIEDALSHRTSLSGHDFNHGPWLGSEARDVIRSLRYLRPYTQPFRTKFQYCNMMYAAIGHVIEKLEGKSFDAMARECLFQPLGMHDTCSSLKSPIAPRESTEADDKILARGYFWVEEEKHGGDLHAKVPGYYVAEAAVDLGVIPAAGALISSVDDYSKWVLAMLKAARMSDNKSDKEEGVDQKEKNVISAELWNDLTTPRTLALPSPTTFPDVNPALPYSNIVPATYALGWFTGPWMYQGETILQHSGGMPGFGTHVFLLPKYNFGIVIAGNAGIASNKLAEQIGRELLGRKIGIPKDERRCEGAFAPKQPDLRSKTEDDHTKAVLSDNSAATMNMTTATVPLSAALPKAYDARKMCGSYSHKAYGDIDLSIVESLSASLHSSRRSLQNVRIVRNSSAQEDREEWGETSTIELIMHVGFKGARSFKFALLLHPPSAETATAHTAQYTFLTLEKLWAHDSLSTDIVPGLAPGFGKSDDAKYPFKQEPVWQSMQIIPCGACFDFTEGRTRLGAILANTESSEAASRRGDAKNLPLEEWRLKMVWFDKVK